MQVTLDGRSDFLSSANLDGDLGDDGADRACSSGILGFLMGAGADGGSCSGLVRQRRVGVVGLLPLELEKKKPPPPARGLASWGRRFLALASSSSRWTEVHSARRQPVPIFLLSALSLSLSLREEEEMKVCKGMESSSSSF